MAGYISSTQGFFYTWLVPGLGHWEAGFKRRGRFYFVLLFTLFLVGQALSRGGAVTYDEHPFYFWLGQWWCLAMAIAGIILNAIVGGGGARYETYEIGQLFVTSAILLNILVWVDLGRRLEAPGKIEDR